MTERAAIADLRVPLSAKGASGAHITFAPASGVPFRRTATLEAGRVKYEMTTFDLAMIGRRGTGQVNIEFPDGSIFPMRPFPIEVPEDA